MQSKSINKNQSIHLSLLPLLLLYSCCLIVGAVAFFMVVASVNLGHIDCGNNCVSSVPPYHSQDALAQMLFWLFVGLGATPLLFTARTTFSNNRKYTSATLAIAAALGIGISLSLYVTFIFSAY
jgi:hypothetical protein